MFRPYFGFLAACSHSFFVGSSGFGVGRSVSVRGVSDDDLPAVCDDLSDLDEGWCLWPAWSHGFSPALVRRLDEVRFVAVVPLLFSWAVIAGDVGRALVGHDDRWCFESLERAVLAASAWDGSGEPSGWMRHPSSGRRRPGGDADAEFVRP